MNIVQRFWAKAPGPRRRRRELFCGGGRRGTNAHTQASSGTTSRRKSSIASRIAGSAFDLEFGSGYDAVLITNFLHHFDPPTCEGFLRKVHAALAPGGRAITVEFVPNEDRLTPPQAARFSLMMLVATERGDAYTFAELDRMFRGAGFAGSELHRLDPLPSAVVISRK